MRMLSSCVMTSAFVLSLSFSPCRADLYTGSGTDSQSGHALAASANFTLNAAGDTLTIVLTNTSNQSYATSQAVPTNLLTALFVTINPTPNPYNLVSATPSNPGVINWQSSFGTVPTNLAVFGSGNNVTGTPGGWQLAQTSLGTAGFNIFNGTATNSGPGQGFNYGIINSSYVNGQGNNAVDNTPLVQNTITFTINVGNFSLSNIKGVTFQYGTDLSEPSFPGIIRGVPEPSTVALALSGFGTLSLMALRRRRVDSVNTTN